MSVIIYLAVPTIIDFLPKNFGRWILETLLEIRKMLVNLKFIFLFPHCFHTFNNLPNNKILAIAKLKVFADDKCDVIKMMTSCL